MITLNISISLIVLAILFLSAFLVFWRVESDYQVHGALSRPVAILQTGYFCVYALSSYLFLDSRLSRIQTAGAWFPAAILLMSIGFLVVCFSMPFLGRQSFGSQVKKLRTDGIYRFSRNPQLMGGSVFVAGYALLWPSWQGAAWAALWLVISHLMVRVEERHLQKVYGDEYHAYCSRTPRYLGLPRK